MYIDSINLSNILSFDNLQIDLNKINFIMGPNNSGKTNIIRILNEIRNQIIGQKTTNTKVLLDLFCRQQSSNKSFEVKIILQLSKIEMSFIRRYFEMLGETEGTRIKNEDIFIQGSGLTNHDEEKKHHSSLIKKYESNKLNQAVKELFHEIWEKNIDEIINTFFPDRKFSIVWKYEEGHREHPEIFLGLFKYILGDREGLGTGYPTRSYFPKDIYGIFSEFKIFIIKHIEKYITTNENIKPFILDLSKKFMKNYLKIDKGVRLKIVIDFERADELRKKFLLEIQKMFPFLDLEHDRNISLTEILTKWFANICYSTENIRYYPPSNKLKSHNFYYLNSSNLPAILFNLKNSLSNHDRLAFRNIQNKFLNITSYNFDVGSEILSSQKENSKDSLEGNIYIYISHKGDPNYQYSISYTGSGINEMLYIITILTMANNGILFFDEPATNLHPTWQKKVLHEIFNRVREDETQLIIITHSPNLLPDLNIESDIINYYYFILNKKEHRSIRNRMHFSSLGKKRRLLIEKRKGLFFSDINILVEGISDERYLKEIFAIIQKEHDDLIGINVEIVNMMGSGNVYEGLIELSKLNLPIRAIFDNDSKGLYNKLNEKNPDFKDQIILLPSDIEGTLIMGDILQIIREIVGEHQYLLKKDIKNFGGWYENKKPKHLSIEQIEKIISYFERLDAKSIDSFNNFLENIIECDIDKVKNENEFNEKQTEIEKYRQQAIDNLERYKNHHLNFLSKEARSVEIVYNHPELLTNCYVLKKSLKRLLIQN